MLQQSRKNFTVCQPSWGMHFFSLLGHNSLDFDLFGVYPARWVIYYSLSMASAFPRTGDALVLYGKNPLPLRIRLLYPQKLRLSEVTPPPIWTWYPPSLAEANLWISLPPAAHVGLSGWDVSWVEYLLMRAEEVWAMASQKCLSPWICSAPQLMHRFYHLTECSWVLFCHGRYGNSAHNKWS